LIKIDILIIHSQNFIICYKDRGNQWESQDQA